MADQKFDEAGFDLESPHTDGNNFAADAFRNEVTEQIKPSKKKYFFFALMAILCIASGYWFFTQQNDSAGSTNEVFMPAASIDNEGNELKPQPEVTGSLTVGNDSNGIKINGHHDLIASLLLQSYPTREEMLKEVSRIQGANVSQEELNVFLLSVKNNADEIRRLKESGGSTAELAKQIADANQLLKELKKDVRELNDRAEKLEKNQGWYQNRLNKLESGSISQPKQAPKPVVVTKTVAEPVRRVNLESQSTWQVNGASENLAFIKNINTGSTLRITRGFDIPGCGQVTDINPAQQKVTTTTCIISN